MWQYYNIQIVQNDYKLGKKIGNTSVFVEKLRAVRAKSFGGIGGYSRCDPITGKCSNYA